MTWFEVLIGFHETSPRQVRHNIAVDGETLISRVNGKGWSAVGWKHRPWPNSEPVPDPVGVTVPTYRYGKWWQTSKRCMQTSRMLARSF